MVNRKTAAAWCTAALIIAAGASVSAIPTLKRTTYLTFSARFALPGGSLPAGTYIFERANADIPNLVRVASRDGSRVYLTTFTEIVQRPRGLRADRQVSFREVPRGVTPPVRAWYPAGETIGLEFIYPENSRQLGGLSDR